jgi:hypothetical protein
MPAERDDGPGEGFDEGVGDSIGLRRTDRDEAKRRPKAANGSDTVEGETRVPHNAQRTETPARYVSIKASSTELSRRPYAR